jgi:hypothetical protein
MRNERIAKAEMYDMANHYFISYSSADAADFALRLADALTAGPPSFPAWLDRRDLRSGDDWTSRSSRRFAVAKPFSLR